MTQKRFSPFLLLISALLIAVLTGLPGAAAVPAQAATPGTWSLTGNLATVRGCRTAVGWDDGRVLVAGVEMGRLGFEQRRNL
jgi:hypothetical protein